MRRSVILTILLLVASLSAILGTLGVLLKREPAFYTAALATQVGENDPIVAAEVVTRFVDLQNDIRSKPEWGATFTAEELNAFFRESFCLGGGFEKTLPEQFREPRVAIDGETVKIAMRYGKGWSSTVLSLELRVWLLKNETNTVALELVSMSAGALPLGVQSLLDWISETARTRNIAVTWYRHDGHPVGLFRFYADQHRPTTQIRRLKVEEGRIIVAGRSLLDLTGSPTPKPQSTAE